MSARAQPARRRWPILRALNGWRLRDFPFDLAAGLTLAAIAIPEQMATARLGGFAPETGFFVFAAGTLGFVLFGTNRHLSSGADSTITPIFAGALGALAAQGSPAYFGSAAALALIVGVVLMAAGAARLGWIANFLSVPVTTGFLAGIAVHIVISQLPAFLGVTTPSGTGIAARAVALAQEWTKANLYCIALGALVFVSMMGAEKINPRIPGALIGLAASIALVVLLHLETKGVAVIGARTISWPHPAFGEFARVDTGNLIPLALLIAVVVMVQTAATTRAFASLAEPQDVNGDFLGVGAGSILAGSLGLFPVNASPPRTAAVVAAGGRSQASSILGVVVVLAVVVLASQLLSRVPLAALAGVLLVVALRIVRFSTIRLVLRESRTEFALILATAVAIVFLPIQLGVGFGIGLSVVHGIWTITRTRTIEFVKVPGTSVWWPPVEGVKGETLARIKVVAFPAPLSFLNAEEFRKDMLILIARDDLDLIVFEASSVAEIDFTASQVLLEIIERSREAHIRFAIARLSSLRAQQALVRFGIMEKLGQDGLYRSVDDALRALADHRGVRPSTAPSQPDAE